MRCATVSASKLYLAGGHPKDTAGFLCRTSRLETLQSALGADEGCGVHECMSYGKKLWERACSRRRHISQYQVAWHSAIAGKPAPTGTGLQRKIYLCRLFFITVYRTC
jgi:hypothetical protein